MTHTYIVIATVISAVLSSTDIDVLISGCLSHIWEMEIELTTTILHI